MRTVRRLFWMFLLPSSAALAQGTVLYSTDFSTLDGWTVIPGCFGAPVLWAVDATPADHPYGPYRSAPASLNFNDGEDFGHFFFRTCGKVRSDPIDLSAGGGDPLLRFWASWECEGGCGGIDTFSLEVASYPSGIVRYDDACINYRSPSDWTRIEVPLDRAWGTVQITFEFDSGDGFGNEGSGVFVDDLEVVDAVSLFCFGDGGAAPCPCGNESAPAERAGCRHSQGGAGSLRAGGRASLADDSLELRGAGMPNQPVLYFQAASSHAAIPFGDGLKCTGGPFVRLGIELNSGGASVYPRPGELPISVRGMLGGPGVRHYQARYRDPAAFCTADNFNYTNALTVEWGP